MTLCKYVYENTGNIGQQFILNPWIIEPYKQNLSTGLLKLKWPAYLNVWSTQTPNTCDIFRCILSHEQERFTFK